MYAIYAYAAMLAVPAYGPRVAVFWLHSRNVSKYGFSKTTFPWFSMALYTSGGFCSIYQLADPVPCRFEDCNAVYSSTSSGTQCYPKNTLFMVVACWGHRFKKNPINSYAPATSLDGAPAVAVRTQYVLFELWFTIRNPIGHQPHRTSCSHFFWSAGSASFCGLR